MTTTNQPDNSAHLHDPQCHKRGGICGCGGGCCGKYAPQAATSGATDAAKFRATIDASNARMADPLQRAMAERDSSATSGCLDKLEALANAGAPVALRAETLRDLIDLARRATPAPQAAAPLLEQDERVTAYVPGQWFDARTLDEMQAFYLSRLPAIREAAKEHGYAIGLHGSLRRDFDLMAMQWRNDASDKDTLAHAIAIAGCGITRDGPFQWEQKPNGRFAVSMPICWTDHGNPEFGDRPSLGHIDLSVITRQAAPVASILMILHCPKCGVQHIDAPDERTEGWVNPPHRSHLCHGCGHIWRPADVPTEGVKAIQTRGKNDSLVADEAPASEQAGAAVAHLEVWEGDEFHLYLTGNVSLEPGSYDLFTAATTASDDPEGKFAQGMLVNLARMGASPAGLSLAAQLFGVGPCSECGFRKLHCRCPAATTASAIGAKCVSAPPPIDDPVKRSQSKGKEKGVTNARR